MRFNTEKRSTVLLVLESELVNTTSLFFIFSLFWAHLFIILSYEEDAEGEQVGIDELKLKNRVKISIIDIIEKF